MRENRYRGSGEGATLASERAMSRHWTVLKTVRELAGVGAAAQRPELAKLAECYVGMQLSNLCRMQVFAAVPPLRPTAG